MTMEKQDKAKVQLVAVFDDPARTEFEGKTFDSLAEAEDEVVNFAVEMTTETVPEGGDGFEVILRYIF